MRHRSSRWLAGPLLALVVWGGGLLFPAHAQPPAGPASPANRPREGPPTAPTNGPAGPAVRPLASSLTKQGDLLRLFRDLPGEAKPIGLEADHITTWNENGVVVMLLEGRALVSQSVLQTRCQKAVAFIDLPRYQTSGILAVALYAEGQVRMDTSVEIQDANRATVHLHTRGELKVRVQRGKITRGDRSNDPVVLKARQLGIGVPPAPPPPPVAAPATPPIAPPPGTLPPVPGVGSAPAAVPGGIQRVGYEVPEVPVRATTSPGTQPGVETPRTTIPPAPSLPPSPSLTPGSRNNPPPSGGASAPPGPAGPAAPVPAPTPAPLPPSANPTPVPGPSPLPPVRQVPVTPPASPPRTMPIPLPGGPPRRGSGLQYRIDPRTGGEGWALESTQLEDGRWMITVSNGVVVSVSGLPGLGTMEVEADRAVVWTRAGGQGGAPVPGTAVGGANDIELYMAGHVVLRTQRPQTQDRVVIDADELYYDTKRNVAIALQSRLEMKPSGRANSSLTEPIVVNAAQLFQTSETTYEVVNAEVFSSKLPSDPGLKLMVARATVEEVRSPRTDIFGRPVVNRRTGEQLDRVQSILRAENVVSTLEGVPFFYTPFLVTDARDPLGPLASVHFGGNRIFGMQAGIGLDMYKLFGVLPEEGTRWRLYLDYLSRRGPAIGTNFTYQGRLYEAPPEELMFFPDKVQDGKYSGMVRLYGIHDSAMDILGGQPPELLTFQPSGYRGRAFWQHDMWDLPGGFDVRAMVAYESDRNFRQQYFLQEFLNAPNQATFAMVKQQEGPWAWTGLVEGRINPWVTATESLPRLDGYLQGMSLFDAVTSHTHATIGYHRLRRSNDPFIPLRGVPEDIDFPSFIDQTSRDTSTFRAAVMQELSYPVNFGAVTFVPYVKGAVVGYSRDLLGEEAAQAWGGIGLRASTSASRLYPEVCSELFNVNGINHKINLTSNYFRAERTDPFNRFPQIDRLNDFVTDQTIRELRPFQPMYYPNGVGLGLATSPLYDPQTYAIRRLVHNRFDTLDHIEVLQLEMQQRLQTKRGFPGAEHIIDWMTLDTSVSLFPQSDRDNFGKPWSFLEYDYVWNIGDRTTFQSTGLYDPQDNGPRVTTVGLYFDRPDRTSYFLGYRQIDPLQSRAVTGSVRYTFSPKYAMTFSATYDLGVSRALNNTLIFTRTGRDLQVSLGFTYNSIQNNFGVVLEIVPNLAGGSSRTNGALMNQQQGGLMGR